MKSGILSNKWNIDQLSFRSDVWIIRLELDIGLEFVGFMPTVTKNVGGHLLSFEEQDEKI